MNEVYPMDAEPFRVPPDTRLVLKRRDGELGCWLQVTLVRRAQARVTVDVLNHQTEGRSFVIDLAATSRRVVPRRRWHRTRGNSLANSVARSPRKPG